MLILSGNSKSGFKLQDLFRPDLVISAAKRQLQEEYKEKQKEIEKRSAAIERQNLTTKKREQIRRKRAERRAAIAAERAFINSLLPSYTDELTPLKPNKHTDQTKKPPTRKKKIDEVPEDNGGHVIILKKG